MNSRGTRNGASGRQLRKTVQGESSEITGGDDTIAPIGNDGVDTASCGNIRPEMETCDDEEARVPPLFRVPFNNFLLLSCRTIDRFFYSSRMKRRKIDEFIATSRIYNFDLKQLFRSSFVV